MSHRSTLDLGLTVLRVGVGATLAVHGAQKLFGWFGGGGLHGTAQAFDSMGFRPGKPSAFAAGVGETAGILLVAGAATPVAGAAVAGTMIGAASVHAPAGFFATEGGYEYPAVLGVAAAALALTGPGRYSVDSLLGHRLNSNRVAVLSLAGAVGAAAAVVARRRNALATPEADAEGPGA